MDSAFGSLRLATQTRDIKCYSLIHLQFHWMSERCQTCVRFKQSNFPVCCHNRQRNFTNNQTGCSRNTGRWQNSVWKLSFVCLTWICWWNQWKNVLFTNANKSLLYLADMFTNKLKTKLNSFYWLVSNTKKTHNLFWRNFPAKAVCSLPMPIQNLIAFRLLALVLQTNSTSSWFSLSFQWYFIPIEHSQYLS